MMTFEEFLAAPISQQVDEGELELWARRSFKEQMQDVYGEANRLVKQHASADEKIETQWTVFSDFCTLTYLSPTVSEGEKESLRVAQWELYDYVFGENTFKNNDVSVMRWFNQWIFDINYACISEG